MTFRWTCKLLFCFRNFLQVFFAQHRSSITCQQLPNKTQGARQVSFRFCTRFVYLRHKYNNLAIYFIPKFFEFLKRIKKIFLSLQIMIYFRMSICNIYGFLKSVTQYYTIEIDLDINFVSAVARPSPAKRPHT